MDKELIFNNLKALMEPYAKDLKVTNDVPGKYELYGTKPVQVGKKQQDGMYFASAVTMKNHVGFYFFPIYTDVDQFEDTPEKLRKCLKGKSCFHIKKDDPEIFEQVEGILKKGFELYAGKDWV